MYDTGVLSAFQQVEQAAGSLWTLIDESSAVFAKYENAHDDVADQLKAMRGSYASSVQFLRALQQLQRNVQNRIKQFAQEIGRFENQISRTALGYGLNLLPDEVLSEIFVLAGTTLEEKVALSLVCKRFRRVMMSMRKMWDGYWIRPDQTPEQIMSIAEGNGFVSLKGRIRSPSCVPGSVEAWISNRRLDHKEYKARYHRFAVGLILSFGPEELEIDLWTNSGWEEIEPILASGNMQNLRHLAMPGVSRTTRAPLLARLSDKWHMPLLRNLEVDFVPGGALGRALVQCSLGYRHGGIGEDEIDSLRKFLATARSLQDLRLFLLPATRFYEVCDLPSLRSLHVNFEPHPSLARHLVRFRLFLPSHRAVSLSRMLDLLSSSEALQELSIDGQGRGFSEDLGTTDPSVVTMPNVVSCELDHEMGPTLVAKLHMPMLRTLTLNPCRLGDLSTMMRNRFRTALQSMSSLEDLELSGLVDIDHLDEIVRYSPPHLESLTLFGCPRNFILGVGWNTSPVPRRKLIRFVYCDGFFPKFLPAFVDYLRAVDLGGIKLQFSDCEECRDGTFVLDDVMSARIDT